jgi:hypothetical protein
MHFVYPRCCGLDVHKKSVSACLLIREDDGRARQQVRRFGTMTRDPLELCDWLAQHEVTHVAMESTAYIGNRFGISWKGTTRLCW